MNLKQVIVIRQDIKLPKGKLAVQVSHASVESAFKSDSEMVVAWRRQGMKKAVLKVADRKALFNYKKLAEKAGLVTVVIRDAGKTFLKPGTVTCIGLGPDEEEKIDKVTGKLGMV